MAKDNFLSESELIEQARTDLDEILRDDDILGACEAFYGHGFADEQDGDVETFGHFYRVHRWIVWTDNYGFHDLETYDSEDEAHKAFEDYQYNYSMHLMQDDEDA
jgi:hypothetical protein